MSLDPKKKFLKLSWSPSLEAKLIEMPFQVFVLVADADSEIDFDEVQTFLKLLEDPKATTSPYTARLFRQTSEVYDALSKKFRKGLIKKNYETIEKCLQLIKKSSTPEQIEFFTNDLEHLAHEIASASGGFLHIGAISDEERVVLKKLKKIFDRLRK